MSENTQTTKDGDIDWGLRATALELAAFSFKYPDSELINALTSGEYAAAVVELAEVGAFKLLPDEISLLDSYKNVASEELLHTLRAEATRLFIGSPEPVVSPYEGVWRAAQEGVQALLFVNPHTMEVERFMKSCGVGSPEGVNEPLDHVATEMEFLQYLSMLVAGIVEPAAHIDEPEEGWSGAYTRFMVEHPQTWMSDFAKSTEEKTREPFYRLASRLLLQLIK